jgi:hypothetical protein
MNSKALFAIFIGAIMIFSAFAGFMMLGGDQGAQIQPTEQVSVNLFGVQGNLVDTNFNGLEDLLSMSPQSTDQAYWIDLEKSANLTDAAREVLPPALGLEYSDRIYQTKIERLGAAYFNGSSAEFHWIRPYGVAYNSLVVPYNGYMMIPQTSDYYVVLGRPTVFGTQKSVESVLDVLSGVMPTDKFTLATGAQGDLQMVSLSGNRTSPPGKYQEFYLGATKTDTGYALAVKYLNPDSATVQLTKKISDQYGLIMSSSGGVTEISGAVDLAMLKGVLTAFLKP